MATPNPHMTARPAGAPTPGGRRDVRRRGITSLLAMLYLIVFAALALGFYAQSNTAVQVSNNERRMKEALVSAETGLAWIRYELSRLTLDPLLTDDQVFEEVQMDLDGQLTGTGNLDGGTVGGIDWMDDPTTPTVVEPPRFEIPAEKDKFIKVNANGPWFRIRIEKQGRDMVVTSVGKAANLLTSTSGSRSGIQVRFQTKEWPNNVFNFGMASRGAVRVDVAKLMVTGTPDSHAGILSLGAGAGAVTIGNASSTATEPTGIEGEVTLLAGSTLSLTGANYKVGGYTTAAGIQANAVNTLTEPPEWPAVDTSKFEAYATTPYVAGLPLYENIFIPPNTNPIISGPSIVRGVVLVHQPNMVNFQGQVQMCAVIIGKDNPAVVNDYTKNYIRFSGAGLSKDPLSALPLDPKFNGLRELTGTFLIAPGFDVGFSGSFGSVVGTVAADRVTISGNTSGSFQGTLMTLTSAPLTITGSSAVSINAPAEDKRPGLRFTERFVAQKSSYKEMSAKEMADKKL